MPRIDDYRQALDLGRQALKDRDPNLVAGRAGASVEQDPGGEAALGLKMLNRDMRISWPEMVFSDQGSGAEPPIQEQILVLHYLAGAWSSGGRPATGSWIAYQEVPDGRFYQDAFAKRAKIPLVRSFGHCPELLLELAGSLYGARPLDQGDLSVVVQALPLVPVALILWRGDEEFPPDGNLLFDRSVTHILSAEDIAWLAGMIVYPLMGLARGG
jgi:hypothetical protein